MGTKERPAPNDCYDAALPDEPMFVLLARDPHAPDAVLQWCYQRERAIVTGFAPESDRFKVEEARKLVAMMRTWRAMNDGAWRR